MADWDDFATELLAVAVGAGVAVERANIVPGPASSRECRQIIVYMEAPDSVPLQREFAGGGFAMPQVTFRCVFTADCYPSFDKDDESAKGTPAEQTAWTQAFLADANTIWSAVYDAAGADELGGCHSVQVGRGQTTGPTGSTASLSFPIVVGFTT